MSTASKTGRRTGTRLTATTKVERFKPAADGPRSQRLWDTLSPGLGVEASKSGRMSWIVRLRDGRFLTPGGGPRLWS